MGIDYKAVVAVGVQRQSIEDFDQVEELIDEGTLNVISPSYDGSGDDDAIIGLIFDQTWDYHSTDFNWDQQRIDELKEEFTKLTGMEAKVWLTPHGH